MRKTTGAAQAAQANAADDGRIMAYLDEIGVSPQTNLIGLLQDVQERFGWLSPEAVKEISRRTKVPLSRVYGVITFYAQFYTEPRGRHTVRVCRGTACHVRGGRSVIHAVQKKLGIGDGETSDDMAFSFETVACLGACALSPVVVIDGAYHGKATPRRVEQLLDRLIETESRAKGAD